MKQAGNYSSIYKGVSWYKAYSRWRAHITVNRCFIHLGYFFTEIEAAKAYNKAAKKYFKEFAYLNVIPEKDKS